MRLREHIGSGVRQRRLEAVESGVRQRRLEAVISGVDWQLRLEGVMSCVGRQLGTGEIGVGSEWQQVLLLGEGRV